MVMHLIIHSIDVTLLLNDETTPQEKCALYMIYLRRIRR